MAYTSDNPLFRSLSDEEEEQFRQYARDHKPAGADWSVYHPVCRDEWRKLGLHLTEASLGKTSKKLKRLLVPHRRRVRSPRRARRRGGRKLTVWSLDVWGHSVEECEEADHESCEGFTVNDRCYVGEIEVIEPSPFYRMDFDSRLIGALVEDGFLKDGARRRCEVEGGDGLFTVVEIATGRPLLQLEDGE